MKQTKLKGFTQHGVVFTSETASQMQGTCPFCSKPYKFYANIKSLLWDCKYCQINGNFRGFLTRIYKHNLKETESNDLQRLARNRKMPIQAFAAYGVAYTGNSYILPVRDAKGLVIDLRIYKIKQRLVSTASCSTGLLNCHTVNLKKNKNKPIFVCEGEFDCIALDYLLKKADIPGVCVAVPGANTFKAEWTSFFTGRDVILAYDHDEAGVNGERKAHTILKDEAESIRFIHWPTDKPEGYDIRDFIIEHSNHFTKCKATHRELSKLMRKVPRSGFGAPPAAEDEEPEEVLEYKTIKDVYETYDKWLFIKDYTSITISLASIVSNTLPGDPLWLFLVSPPGGSKTEILNTYNQCENIFTTSSLTPQSLISGANFGGSNRDPSLIPKLNGKVLIIKDFTSILSKRDVEKEEIFGILRDAYDGYCSKQFGTGVRRSYVSHFTVIAGVTPAIYESSTHHHSLGERFLKFTIGSNLEHFAEDSIIGKAIDNITNEAAMREELAHTVRHFILRKSADAKATIPFIPPVIKNKIINLARFGARMRGTVTREKYRPELITTKPSAEVGSRLGKQVAKLAISLAIVHERANVDESDYVLCKKCVLDTINQRNEDIVQAVYTMTAGKIKTVKTKEIMAHTKYTYATIARLLTDMVLLNIVIKTGSGNAYEYKLSPYIIDLIKKADLYTAPQEINRIRPKIRLKKRKK